MAYTTVAYSWASLYYITCLSAQFIEHPSDNSVMCVPKCEYNMNISSKQDTDNSDLLLRHGLW